MIEARRRQLHFGEGLIAEEVSDLREERMKHADRALDDEQLVSTVYEALSRRRPKSRTRGRRGTPAEVVLRLLLLQHLRNWSYDVLEREVRANLVYRDFTRYHRRTTGVKKANPHRFRHTFASDMVRAGVSLPALMQLMGHARIETTMVYIEVTPLEVYQQYAKAVTQHIRPVPGRAS